MSEHKVHPVPESWGKSAWCDEAGYFKLYEQSIKDPEGFWGEQGKRIDWIKPYSQVKDVSFGPGDVHIKWYHDGTLNGSSPSQMIAVWSPRVSRWRSRQLCDALRVPSWNHLMWTSPGPKDTSLTWL